MNLDGEIGLEKYVSEKEDLLLKGLKTGNKKIIEFLGKTLCQEYKGIIEDSLGTIQENNEIKEGYKTYFL
jgi:hypothetical protein